MTSVSPSLCDTLGERRTSLNVTFRRPCVTRRQTEKVVISQLPELEDAWKLLGEGRAAEARDAAARVLARVPGNVSATVCHAMANWKAEGDISLSLRQM